MPFDIHKASWEERAVFALKDLGGEAHLQELYRKVYDLAKEAKYFLSFTYQETLRRTLQESERITQDQPRSGVWRLVDAT